MNTYLFQLRNSKTIFFYIHFFCTFQGPLLRLTPSIKGGDILQSVQFGIGTWRVSNKGINNTHLNKVKNSSLQFIKQSNIL
jgi:hypothetical protein